MAGKERGLFRLIFKNFFASLRPNFNRRTLIGEDFYGTKYYEDAVPTYSSRTRAARSFVPVNKNDHTQELPAEWESWLRYRRIEPPTKEEVEENYMLALKKKENALLIEAKYSEKRKKLSDVPTAQRGMESFPTYEEYEQKAESYKIKKPY